MCGRGYLRRNLDNVRVVGDRDALPGKPPSTREPQGLCIDTVDFKPPQHHHHNHDHRHYHHGLRRSSLSSSPGSSGSSPASSTTGTPASTSPGSGCWLFNSPPPPPRRTAEFFADGQQAARGSIFARRTDMAVFSSLPRHAWNTYNIRSEDEGPHGTDETRSFLLTVLSTRGITCVDCAVCRASMTVYDTYPLVDGTFYLSPVRCDDSSILVTHRDRPRYLSAVCVSCMTGGARARLQCRACGTPWNGSVLVVGSMYAYDVFAAAPCCPARLACNRCDLEVTGRNGASPQSYSDYSRSYVCPHCNADDYHFVKPLGHVYLVAQQ